MNVGLCSISRLALLALLSGCATVGGLAEQNKAPAGKMPETSASRHDAQTPLQAKFTARSRLVLVPVVVTRDNSPVRGLRKEDFTIYEDGKQQRIAVFEEVKTDASPVTSSVPKGESTARQFSNMQLDRRAPKRLVIIVLDLINTGFADRVFARQQLIKYLSSSVDNGALVSLVALGRGRIKVIHDFTSSPETLVAALKRANGRKDGSLLSTDLPVESRAFEHEVAQIPQFLDTGKFSGAPFGRSNVEGGYELHRIQETLDGLNLIAQAYAGVPGRKALIWATGGFPFQVNGSTMMMEVASGGPVMLLEKDILAAGAGTAQLSDIRSYYQHTWELMNNANIALYPVDARGLIVDQPGADADIHISKGDIERGVHVLRQKTLLNRDILFTFGTFADMTGGRAFYNTNDIAGSFKKASTDSASYYLLAYYLERSAGEDKQKRWRKLKVQTALKDVSVRARSGFFVGDNDESTYKDEIALALTSPLDFTALPVTVRWLDQKEISAQGQAEKDVLFEISVPPNAVTIDEYDRNGLSVRVAVVATSEEGKKAGGIAQTVAGHLRPDSRTKMRTSGFVFKSAIKLPPGRYSVRFVVRDDLGGRTGSVAAPVEVR